MDADKHYQYFDFTVIWALKSTLTALKATIVLRSIRPVGPKEN
jgi:hypothetical protein